MVSNWLILIFPTHTTLSSEATVFACSVVFPNFFQLLTVPRTHLLGKREEENLQLLEATNRMHRTEA